MTASTRNHSGGKIITNHCIAIAQANEIALAKPRRFDDNDRQISMQVSNS